MYIKDGITLVVPKAPEDIIKIAQEIKSQKKDLEK